LHFISAAILFQQTAEMQDWMGWGCSLLLLLMTTKTATMMTAEREETYS
jgi:hypothetical protein